MDTHSLSVETLHSTKRRQTKLFSRLLLASHLGAPRQGRQWNITAQACANVR